MTEVSPSFVAFATRLQTLHDLVEDGVREARHGSMERGRMVLLRDQVDDLISTLPDAPTGLGVQEAERLARRLESAAKSIRDALKPPKRGVFLYRALVGYTINVDGLDLGMDIPRADADALCKVIASRRPPGDDIGYGVYYDRDKLVGYTTEAVTLSVSLRGPGPKEEKEDI